MELYIAFGFLLGIAVSAGVKPFIFHLNRI
jgi:hypothetical protein